MKIVWLMLVAILCQKHADIENLHFMGCHFQAKIDYHAGICTNVNSDFQILHAPSIPKMYRFANPHKL